MATLEIYGLDGLEDAIRAIADIPFSVKEDALNAMSGVAAKAIRNAGESMGVKDPESDVHILDKIKINKAKETDSGARQDITFSGTRTRGGIKTRNAEIAFINEYGKKGQAARPFVGRAMTDNADEIQDPGEKIILDWIDETFNK